MPWSPMQWLMLIVAGVLIFGMGASFIAKPRELVLPPGFKKTPITGIASTLLQTIGVPDQWLFIPAIIYLFLVPLIGIIAIVYGFLDMTRVFDNPNVNIILSFVIAFATLPFGVFTRFVTMAFAFLGAYSTGAGIFLIFFSILYAAGNKMNMWGFGRGGGRSEVQAIQLITKYNAYKSWLEEVATNSVNQNMQHLREKIIPQIYRILNRAENARERNLPNAVRNLERAVIAVEREVLRAGGTTPRRPHI